MKRSRVERKNPLNAEQACASHNKHQGKLPILRSLVKFAVRRPPMEEVGKALARKSIARSDRHAIVLEHLPDIAAVGRMNQGEPRVKIGALLRQEFGQCKFSKLAHEIDPPVGAIGSSENFHFPQQNRWREPLMQGPISAVKS